MCVHWCESRDCLILCVFAAFVGFVRVSPLKMVSLWCVHEGTCLWGSFILAGGRHTVLLFTIHVCTSDSVLACPAVVQSTVTKYQDVFHNTVAKVQCLCCVLGTQGAPCLCMLPDCHSQASRLETALRKYFGHGGPHPPHV